MAARTLLFIISVLYLTDFTLAFSLQHVMARLNALEAKFDMLDMENKLRRSETEELFRRVSEISTGSKMITPRDHMSHGAFSDFGERASHKEISSSFDRTTILPNKGINKTTKSALELQKLKYYLTDGAKVEKDKNLKLRTELKDIGNMLKTNYTVLESNIKAEIRNLTNRLSETKKSLETDYTSFKSYIREDISDFKAGIKENQNSLVSVERFDNFTNSVTTALSTASNESRQAILSLKLEFEMSISVISNNVSTVSKTLANINYRQTEIEMSIQELLNGLSSMNTTLTNIPRRSCRNFQQSGVYNLYPNEKSVSSVRVYCDQTTDGGGWLVFQRRKDGSLDFYRNWADYKIGFGNVANEFLIGNDNLHAFTSAGFNELRIDMEDFEGNKRFAKYNHFKVFPESQLYRLEVRGYSGNAGDSLTSWHNGMSFSTKDRDNDKWALSCAPDDGGAWWYEHCGRSNLNGCYNNYGANSSFVKGIFWVTWKGWYYSLKTVEMKIR